ncbi:unnamed protein product [Prorocentrum cordatum]|uniref:EF-hand domain-containing protein n=1 Tax=Prorocentrum cordatum TaxID=2364126 RepID=A0ABN9WZE7_9DINO|nr:unnamed protein product [Polarella glacialis]
MRREHLRHRRGRPGSRLCGSRRSPGSTRSLPSATGSLSTGWSPPPMGSSTSRTRNRWRTTCTLAWCPRTSPSLARPLRWAWRLYFHTREGNGAPQYQVIYTRPDPEGGDVPAFSMVLDWTEDVDALWIEALTRLEDSNELSEDALAFLDADPLWLIADTATQRTLEKTAVVPMLRCMGQRPCLEEWYAYLNADEEADAEYRWVVESFAEVELPHPRTSFKGVGSVVCYLNNDTNETTWKHPFYDYFAQLLNHCRRSTPEEHIKLRINRVLWSYEAESQTDVQSQMPLVSPKYVKVLADILKCDLNEEPYMVRTLKTFLKAFSQMYHEGELDTQEACRLAQTMQVPLAEMQRAYAAFRDHAEPLAPGADMLRDGRLGQEQFARLMQSQLNLDSDVLAERQVQLMASSVKKVCKAMALKYGLDPVEIDRYKKEFDELDVDRSGRIDSQEMESFLSFIGRADMYKPVLGDSIGFEEFLIFRLRYLTPGATGFRQSSGSTGGDARPEA